ncbi:MAG: proline iminopeptidase-family hydrolase [Gemmatimonadota bacterium]|nr:proline iminopeptidase-family hydrolase [Gemmatimonadota bacterium]
MTPRWSRPRAGVVSAWLFTLLAGCSSPESGAGRLERTESEATAVRAIAPSEGSIAVPGGNVWYRVVGEGDGVPLLLLHGGPGAGSRGFEPFEALGADRPVVFYDQLGAGRSEKPSDTSLWTIERHIAEIDAVRDALGLDEVHILGHSWGSMLLIEYLLTDPAGVRSATFASPLFSTARWLADAKRRVTELPQELQDVIEVHETAGTTDSPEYMGAVTAFYQRYLLRTDPWPPLMTQTMEEFGYEVYAYMWGPSEFTATGTLETWDRMDALPGLGLPTLFTVGEFDETFPETVADYASRVPGARFEEIPAAAHMTMLDAPEANVRIMQEFLRNVEGR